MNFDINEMEYFPIPKINQLDSYNTKLLDGIKEQEVYKTSIYIEVVYYDNELNSNTKEIVLPFELNLGDKELTKLELVNVDISVIDNQGINVEYFIEVEVSDVDVAFDQENLSFEETQVSNIEEYIDVEETKSSITSSYEDILDHTGIREDIPIKYTDSECPVKSLKEDFMNIKVLFNINVDDVDKIAFAHNLSIDSCFKKLTKDKTRLII